MYLKFPFKILWVHIPFKLMANGFGDHGYHAQQHAVSELKPGHQHCAMVHFMVGCHAREVDKKLKLAKVN